MPLLSKYYRLQQLGQVLGSDWLCLENERAVLDVCARMPCSYFHMSFSRWLSALEKEWK